MTSSKINAIASHGFRHSIAKAGALPDAVGQIVRVYRFFQAQGQRFYVVARQAAVGDEPSLTTQRYCTARNRPWSLRKAQNPPMLTSPSCLDDMTEMSAQSIISRTPDRHASRFAGFCQTVSW